MVADLNKYPALQGLLDSVAEIAGYLWNRGWSERNAGNLSINITSLLAHVDDSQEKRLMPGQLTGDSVSERTLPAKALQLTKDAETGDVPVQAKLKELGGHTLLVSVAGSRMRDMAKAPEKHCGLLTIESSGSRFSFSPLVSIEPDRPFTPTSELPTHLLIHQLFAQLGGERKAVLHCHPTETIAMTHLLAALGQEAINERLRAMHAEMTLLVPDGIGLISEILPGSEALARDTLTSLETHDIALWRGHGCIASGPDLIEAFDKIDIVNKVSSLFLRCAAAGEPKAGLTRAEVDHINKHWNGTP